MSSFQRLKQSIYEELAVWEMSSTYMHTSTTGSACSPDTHIHYNSRTSHIHMHQCQGLQTIDIHCVDRARDPRQTCMYRMRRHVYPGMKPLL